MGPVATGAVNRAIRAASGSLLTIGVAIMASPIGALAATPEGTAGGGSDIIPGPDPVSMLVELVVKVVVIAIGITILVVLGYGVAHIGGRPVATLDPADGVRSRSRLGWTAIVVIAAIASVIGVLAGREIAEERSAGGFGFIGAAIYTMFVGVAVVGLVLVGLIATKFRHGQVTTAIASILGAGALLALGTIGGSAAASAFGGLSHEPVFLDARGATKIEMRPGGGAFVAKDGGLASCRSSPDGRGVGSLSALELGELGSGTLRAGLEFWGPRPDQARGSFFIDGADISEGAMQPSWSATVVIVEWAADGASGKLTFDAHADAGSSKDPGGWVGDPANSKWPAQIAGTISWTCEPW